MLPNEPPCPALRGGLLAHAHIPFPGVVALGRHRLRSNGELWISESRGHVCPQRGRRKVLLVRCLVLGHMRCASGRGRRDTAVHRDSCGC